MLGICFRDGFVASFTYIFMLGLEQTGVWQALELSCSNFRGGPTRRLLRAQERETKGLVRMRKHMYEH